MVFHSQPMDPPSVVLAIGIAIAVVTDLKHGKIYNAISFPLIVLGLLIHWHEGAVSDALYGIGIGFFLHYGMWALGVQKGGDAKLMIAVGALLGWEEMLQATLWEWILYLPVGLSVLAIRGRLSNLVKVFRWLATPKTQRDPSQRPEPTSYRTGPLIAIAVILAWFSTI
jgi:Flp pilus assembly protein protease CpaA